MQSGMPYRLSETGMPMGAHELSPLVPNLQPGKPLYCRASGRGTTLDWSPNKRGQDFPVLIDYHQNGQTICLQSNMTRGGA